MWERDDDTEDCDRATSPGPEAPRAPTTAYMQVMHICVNDVISITPQALLTHTQRIVMRFRIGSFLSRTRTALKLQRRPLTN